MSPTILQQLKKDPILKKAIDTVNELPIPRNSGDLYLDLVQTIAYQQISGKAAEKIFGRFLELFEDSYPHPYQVLALEIEDLRSVGFSRQKSAYIQNIAQFFQEEKLMNVDWSNYSDDDLINYLTQIKGVGKWTVQMILMFTLERPDVFPVDDYGVQSGMMELYEFEAKGAALKKKMIEIAENWKPYRSYGSRYIWRWKDTV